MTSAEAPTYGLVGALAALPRRLAARAVERIGGRLQRGLTRSTTHVVVGRTLLARPDAEIEARVGTARGGGRQLLSENGLLRLIGVLQRPETADLRQASLLEQSGLAPSDFDHLALFDAFEHDAEPWSFRDLILAKKYAGLVAGGASWAAIARSIHRCGAPVSLTAKSLQIGGGRTIYARDGDGLSELNGQFVLDLALREDNADELFAAAEAAEEEGRAEDAALLYARCLALDPGDAVAAFNRANALRAAGRTEEAEHGYARALKLDPRFVEAWFNLAGLVAEHGRRDAARRHLARAIACDPDYADAVFNLAVLAFDAGDLAEAGRWWARYLELDCTSEWARTASRGLRFIDLHAAHGKTG